MTHDEFLKAVIGKPWVNRADGMNEFDCWGLVVAYYREVLGITIPVYLGGDIQSGYLEEIESGRWKEGQGIVFMCFIDGIPSHCGLVFDNQVLHSNGWKGSGQVTMQPLRKIQRIFKDVKIYAYC